LTRRGIGIVLIVASMMLCFILPASGSAQDTSGIQVMAGSPGDTVTFQGTGEPCSEANVDVSTVTEVATSECVCTGSGTGVQAATRSFSLTMDNIRVDPARNTVTISVSPVTSASITVVAYDVAGYTVTRDIPVSGGKATISYNNIPPGRYKVTISGYTTANKVGVTVNAGAYVPVGKDGRWIYRKGTVGLPASKYVVRQNGQVVGMVYLGVPMDVPPGPTCTPAPRQEDACPPAYESAQQSLGPNGITGAVMNEHSTSSGGGEALDGNLVEATVIENITAGESGPDGQEQATLLPEVPLGAAGTIAVILCTCAAIGVGTYLLLFRKK